MADPMKIKAQLKGDVTEIRVLMPHAMETGQRKDASGKVIPAHFIQNVSVTLNGKPIVEGQIGASVSKSPVFAFKVKVAKAGDKVAINWIDNHGDKRSDETTVAA